MHARVEQLLSLRDGEPVDALLRTHVDGCATCSDTLAGLVRMPQALAQLPTVGGGLHGWSNVQERIAQRQAGDRRRLWVAQGALAASLIAIAVTLAWRVNDTSLTSVPARQIALDVEHALAIDRTLQLRSQSQALEDLLAEIPAGPLVERAGTALSIDALEAEVQWLDHELSVRGEDLSPNAAERLWRERVETMNSLVQLRYVDAQRSLL